MACELCDARQNEADRVVYQDEYVFVLVNIEPLKNGHVMVLPVRHAEGLKDLTSEEAQAFLKAIDLCMDALTRSSDETPICHVNGWKHRSQPHLHAHVVPSKGGLRELLIAAEGVGERKRAESSILKKMADEFKAFLSPMTS